MRFRVMDNKTGKEADTWNIALREEWAQGLVYCDMEGFAITEDGYLMLADECGHVVYCDTERFKVVFEDERPQWIPCSERLPHAEYGESDSVLCQLEDDTMKVLYWDGGNWCHPTGELYHCVNHKNGWHNRVIAWMPLPKPYKKEGELSDYRRSNS